MNIYMCVECSLHEPQRGREALYVVAIHKMRKQAKMTFQFHNFLLGLLLSYSTMTALVYYMVEGPTATLVPTNLIYTKSSGNVCVCLADNRFSERDLLLAEIESDSALKDFIAQDPQSAKDWGYWRKTALINTAYALKHGHNVVVSDLSAYQSTYNESRSSVWLKPAFMLDLQYKRPDCQWFAMLDSDAYFWMANHTVALSEWFATKSLHEATPRYYQYEDERRRRNGYYDWGDGEAILHIGLNGVFSEPQEGFPNAYGGKKDDFMCAGVYFLRNSHVSKRLLHDWVHGPSDASSEEREAMAFYAHKFPFEQRILNLVLFPRYRDYIHIHSYRDFGSKDGTMIRHVWSQFSHERSSLIESDLIKIESNFR